MNRNDRAAEFRRVHSREQLITVREDKNAKYDSAEFTGAVNRLISGDETAREYVESVLAHRALSAFIQQGHHPE